MLRSLRVHNPQLIELACERGSLLIPPALNGRLFCQLDDELIHRLDAAAMQSPSPDSYDNLGGNSLWPAPEGGPFAFNYPPDADTWYVQAGIAKSIPNVMRDGPNRAVVDKRISLVNRKGMRANVEYQRRVMVLPIPEPAIGYGLHGICYETDDVFTPLDRVRADDFLLAPWSLEQFPGADGIVAFGKTMDGKNAVNADFYGDPGDRIVEQPWGFTFQLGGADRHQIGLRVSARPECIGAIDRGRSLLILRKTQCQDGLYFNIADNDQSGGPFSAADLYSIFNGGELGFFELETIGAMQTTEGHLSASSVHSQTSILRGPREALVRYLEDREEIVLDDAVTRNQDGGT